MAKSTPAANEAAKTETPALASAEAGPAIVDNTEAAETPVEAAGVESEYELSPGLLQVNYA